MLVAFTARAGCYVDGVYSKRKACDVNYRTNKDTRKMLRTVPGRVWLTETGGIVRVAGSRFDTFSTRRAAQRTKYMGWERGGVSRTFPWRTET